MRRNLLFTLGLFAAFSVLNQNASADPVSEGKTYFTQYTCNTCHSLTSKKEPTNTGPALYGVTKRRTKDWLIPWISDPEEMLKKDATAKKLLAENGNVPMTPMLKLMNKKPDGSVDTAAVKAKAEALYAFLKDNDSHPEGGADAGVKKKKN
jgi:hypothetical protein